MKAITLFCLHISMMATLKKETDCLFQPSFISLKRIGLPLELNCLLKPISKESCLPLEKFYDGRLPTLFEINV